METCAERKETVSTSRLSTLCFVFLLGKQNCIPNTHATRTMKFPVSIAFTVLGISSVADVSAFQTKSSTLPSLNGRPLTPTTTTKSLLEKKTNRASFSFKSVTTTSTQLESVSPLTAIASSPIGALSVLAGIIVVHEAGHYLAARSFNITVEEFAIGFGPKLLGFEALGNDFNLRALPLGGYVRFPENYNITEAEVLRREAQNAFMKRREAEEWTWKEDAANILTFGMWDERRREARKAETESQLEIEVAQRSWWQKILSQKKNQGTGKDPEDVNIEYYEDPNLLQNRPWTERAVVLSGGVIFNMLLAFSLYFGEIQFGSGIPQPSFDAGVVVSQTPRSDGAAAGLLKQGDLLVAVNGRPLEIRSPTPKGASMQVSDVIGSIRQTPAGGAIEFKVLRNAKEVDVAITPKTNGGSTTIGVMLGPNFKRTEKLQSKDTIQAAKLAYQYLSQVISQTLDGVLSLIGMFLMGQSPPPGQSVSGPIGLIRSGTEIVSTRDLTAVILFASALSVNLGVINALPLPALDGGQLAFVLAEAVTGKKIDQKLQEGITSVAVLLLLFLSVSTAVSDVGSIITSR